MKKDQKTEWPIALAMVLFVFARASAQTPDLFFEQSFPYATATSYLSFADKPYCYVTEVAPSEESEGYCLMIVNYYKQCFFFETESMSRPLIYKVSQQGELLGELALGFEGRFSFVFAVYQEHDNPQCFLAVGKTHDNDHHYDRPFMARFDLDLCLLWQREIELPEAYHNYISFGSVMDGDGDIFCSSYLYDCGGGESFSRFCFRLTPEGELDGVADLSLQSEYQNVFTFPDGSGDYGLLENLESRPNNQLVLLRMNKAMEQVNQLELPHKYVEMDPTNTYPSLTLMLTAPQSSPSGRHAMATLSDGSLILANEATIIHQDITHGIYENLNGIGFLWVSPEGEAASCAMDGELTPGDSLKMLLPVLPAGDDSFYFVYTMGQNFGYDYMNCCVVGKMDWEGHLLWRRYWNRYFPEYGMKIYYPQDAVVSHDDGCLITGFSFSSDINATSPYTYEPDVFLLKFFADGTLAVPEIESMVRPYAFWPNPTSDRLSLEYSPDAEPVRLELFDLNGRLLSLQNKLLDRMDLSGIPAGVYSLRITFQDGTSYADKIVKQ